MGLASPVRSAAAMPTLALVLALSVVLVGGCAAPIKQDTQRITVPQALEDVHCAVLDVLVTIGAEIARDEQTYVETFVPARALGLIGPVPLWSIGDRVGVWIEPAAPGRTHVYADTVKRGRLLGSAEWHRALLEMIRRASAKAGVKPNRYTRSCGARAESAGLSAGAPDTLPYNLARLRLKRRDAQ
jgi:hypothetical protein